MKKFLVFIIAVLMTAIVAGCSGETKESTPTSEPVVETTEATEVVAKAKTIDVIPDPKEVFTEGNVAIIMSDPTAYYQVSGYQEGEYDIYVEACKEMGFTDIKHESEAENGTRLFFAYDEGHEYYLEVTINGENNLLDITCKPVEAE